MATNDTPEEAIIGQNSPNAVDYSSKDIVLVQEELERKLKCRAERDALVQKNILPAVSASSIILAQTQQLARARTADTLQQKLRERVSKSELQERNILPDISDAIDPSLHAHQLQLQKRKLVNNLNNRIANRPGILELVEGRILEPTNVGLAEAAMSSLNSVMGGNSLRTQREAKFSDSSSPMQSPGDPYNSDISSPPRIASPSSVPPPLAPPPPPSILSKSLKLSTNNIPPGCGGEIGKSPSPSQSRKKQQKGKYRKLRYHEYVPPTKTNAKGGKTTPSKPPKMDTPYALLLQQQQVFLQLQVLQQQYPNGVLAQKLPDLLKNMPASVTEKAQAMLKPKIPGIDTQKLAATITKTHEIPEDIKVQGPNGTAITVRLDELKVNSLKGACKEMNLIVSGKKVELIERLLEHNNGILPSSVLQDQKRSVNQTPSFESQVSNTTSPESPSPSPVFQYSKSLGSASFSSFFQPKETMPANVAMETTSDLPEVVPASEFITEFDQMVERRKVDYLNSKSVKPIVAPRPNLKQMIAIKLSGSSSSSQIVPETNSTTNSNHVFSRSLPSSPQQLSPTESASDLLQDLMEQSPLTFNQTESLLTPSSSSSSSHPSPVMTNSLINGSQYPMTTGGRHGRCSLPNPPPPYPGLHHSYDPSNYLYTRAPPPLHSSHSISSRSYSISGPHPSLNSNGSRSLSLDLPTAANSTFLAQTNKPMVVPSTDNFLFPADEGAPASDLMDIDHSQLTDLLGLEMFDQSGAGDNGSSNGQGIGFGQTVNHSSSTGATSSLRFHQNPSAVDMFNSIPTDLGGGGGFMNTSRDIKPTISGGYNDMSWLNIEGGTLLNNSNIHSGYIHDGGTAGLQPYEHFQLGLEDSTGLKSSNGSINALPTANDTCMYLDASMTGHCGLYGPDSSTLLNLDLAS